MMRRLLIRPLAVAACLFSVAAQSGAETSRPAMTDQQILEHSIQAKADEAKNLASDPLFSDERTKVLRERHAADAKAIEKASAPKLQESLDELIAGDEKVQKILESAAAETAGEQVINAKYRLFVSRGQGEAAMQEIVEIGKRNPDLVIVLRGLLPGEKVTDLASYIGRLIQPKEDEPIPNIMLDPPSFTERGVSVVPTLERLDPMSGDVLASVQGIANPAWLEDRVAKGERGALGRFGETSEIAEEDMILAMQAQAAKWDAEAYGKKVADSMWSQLDMIPLPTATVSAVREVDPSIVITDAVTAPDGTVIAYPGQKVNPFDVVPFDMTLIVIDAQDVAQVAFARRKLAELDGKSAMVIATELPREDGWKGLGDTINGVGRMVYLLQPEMIERFGLRAVPCTVEGGNRVLVVREYAREDFEKGVTHAGAGTAKG